MKSMINKSKKASKSMNEDDFSAAVTMEIQQAASYIQEIVSPERQNALNAYLGNSLGNERDGRSKFISRDVLEAVLWILPQLLETFVASDDIVVASPVDGSNTDQAEQASALLNHIFYKDNAGFMVLYNWFHDALVMKNGFVKAYYEPNLTAKVEQYPSITLDSLLLMQSQDGAEVIDYEFLDLPEGTPEPDITSIPQEQLSQYLVRAKVVIKSDKGKICIENIPPEELLISREAKTIPDARFVGHRIRKTASDLVEMGVPRDVIDELPTYNLMYNNEFGAETLIRNPDSTTDDPTTDKANRPICLVEGFLRIDYDGDGIAELRKVLIAGDTSGISKVLKNEEFAGSRTPIFDLCFIPIPHRFFGNSIPDVTNDLQILRTTVIRNILDNFYLTNNPDLAIMAGALKNPEVLATVTPGRNFLVTAPNAIMPVPQSTMSAAAFPLLEAIDTWKESRTGVSRYSQGLDPSAINKTASGISQILDASRQRVKLYARIAAETGVKELMEYIFECTLKYQYSPKVIQMKEEYITVNPREWKSQMAITLNVGLGTGNKEQNLAHLNSIMNIQQQMAQSGGAGLLVTPDNIYNAAIKVVENSGIKTPELYFSDPQGKQPPPAPPDPKVQAEQQKMEFEKQKFMLQNQQDQQKQQMDMQQDQQKFMAQQQLEREKIMAEIELEREKMLAEIEIKREQMHLELQFNHINNTQKSLDSRDEINSPNISGGLKP